ncbi:MAG: helix-turn-helix transcriptional regulator [Clostridia bacterium]|nr:helix-turn-helix transcriptional regulator [Clostridia bacterium]
MNTNQKIGERIKNRRKELELTQEQIGNLIGVTKSTIQRYENGLIKDLKMPVIQAIANALKVNPDWIVLKSDIKELQVSKHPFDTSNLSNKELKLITTYNILNDIGKNEAQKRVEELTLIDKYTKLNNKQSEEEYITEVAARGNSELSVKLDKKSVLEDLNKPMSYDD